MKTKEVWILTGVDAHSETLIGVFATGELAEQAKDEDEDYYAFYTIRCYEVKQ
jgi:hypothetical protein